MHIIYTRTHTFVGVMNEHFNYNRWFGVNRKGLSIQDRTGEKKTAQAYSQGKAT
jgi:hypothetical protein